MAVFLSEKEAAKLGISGAEKPRKRPRDARPNLPRAENAARGDGDRQKDLEKLARAGYTCTHYDHKTGEHWMTGAAGTTPKAATYREMLDTALCLSQTRPDEVTQ